MLFSDMIKSATLLNQEVLIQLDQLEKLKKVALKAVEDDHLFVYKATVQIFQAKRAQVKLKEELLDEILDLIPLKYFLR